ncbi:hypothetical protein FB451DRAFT_1392035 [Mycena latifolia]|nr:hypothetical protein FB451DRAFT_1392035 [Mycena latifolia]
MMNFVLKHLFPSSLASFTPIVSLVGFGLSSLIPVLGCHHAQLSANFTPSRVSGIPTKTFIVQDSPGVFTHGILIFILVIISLVAIHQWIRSPGSPRRRGCLRKEDRQPPPPPPPPPQPPASLNSDGQDGDPDGDEANGGGDDGPEQDGAADDDDGIRDGDGLAVGAAPAPEDPPPPAGDVEEHGDDDGLDSLSGSGISWLLLLLLGRIISGPFTGTSKVNSVKPYPVKPAVVEPAVLEPLPLASATRSPVSSPWQDLLFPSWIKMYSQLTVLPGLAVAVALLGLLLEQEQELEVVADPEQAVLLEPQDRQQEAHDPPPEPRQEGGPEPPPPDRREDPELELPPPDHQEPEPQERALEPPFQSLHEQEEAPEPLPLNHLAPGPNPAPEWIATREKIRLALFQHAPGPAPEEDQAARAKAVDILQRMATRRAALPAAQEDDAERKRRAEVQRVQRRLWALLCDLALRRDGAEGIEEADG